MLLPPHEASPKTILVFMLAATGSTESLLLLPVACEGASSLILLLMVFFDLWLYTMNSSLSALWYDIPVPSQIFHGEGTVLPKCVVDGCHN